MGVQPLNLEDRIEIVDPNNRVPDEFPVIPQDTFMGVTWGRVNLDHILHEWFGHQEPMIFNRDGHRTFILHNTYVFVNMKKKEKKSKKENEYKDLMNQILSHVDVSYKCDYYAEKEVEHSYPLSAPISFLVR
jgi:hypothetical protein